MNPENKKFSSENKTEIKSSKWDILSKYAEKEEFRERTLVSDLADGTASVEDFESQKIEDKPKKLETLRRVVLDAMGVKSDKLEEKRRREAMPGALRTYAERKKASGEAYRDGLENIDETVLNIDRGLEDFADIVAQNEKDQREIGNLSQNFIAQAEEKKALREIKKQEQFEEERAQEILEKKFNQKLTKLDDIENMAEAGGLGVEKSEIDYNGEPINVYNIQGAPMNMLTHTISFKESTTLLQGDYVNKGQRTAEALRALPNIWLTRRDQISPEQFRVHIPGVIDDGVNYVFVKGNTISTSYTSTEIDDAKSVPGDIIYGFDHLASNSLLGVSTHDGRRPQTTDVNTVRPTKNDINFIEDIENGASEGTYNEVWIARYSENGYPKRPDYLLTYDGKISEDAKNHASTFKVPIVNIERKYYERYEQYKKEGIKTTP